MGQSLTSTPIALKSKSCYNLCSSRVKLSPAPWHCCLTLQCKEYLVHLQHVDRRAGVDNGLGGWNAFHTPIVSLWPVPDASIIIASSYPVMSGDHRGGLSSAAAWVSYWPSLIFFFFFAFMVTLFENENEMTSDLLVLLQYIWNIFIKKPPKNMIFYVVTHEHTHKELRIQSI